MTVTIKNTNENYGDDICFTGDTLAEAVADMQAKVRECGPEFADVEVIAEDYEVLSNPYEMMIVVWDKGQLFADTVIGGRIAVLDWEEPIDASSDSWEIAEAVCRELGVEAVSVDHAGEFVHIECRG